jgi:hypothetical protein
MTNDVKQTAHSWEGTGSSGESEETVKGFFKRKVLNST